MSWQGLNRIREDGKGEHYFLLVCEVCLLLSMLEVFPLKPEGLVNCPFFCFSLHHVLVEWFGLNTHVVLTTFKNKQTNQ